MTTAHIRRHRKRYLVATSLLLFAIALISGFAADLGVAALARLPGLSSVYVMSDLEHGYGPASLDENIVGSDVVARVTLNSVSQVVELHDYSVGDTVYARALEFKFDVLEYLKGSGGGTLVAVAYDLDTPFNTRAGAALLGEDFLGTRDTQYDDREAIVFLVDNHPSLPSTSRADRYWFGNLRFNGEDRYTIASDLLKLWFPADQPGGATGASGTSTQRFLTGLPPERVIGVTGASAAPRQAPTITLSEVKIQIAEVDGVVNRGDGSREYLECLYRKYKWGRKVDYETNRLGYYYHGTREHDLQSGMATGTEVLLFEYSFTYIDAYGLTAPEGYEGMFWLEGEDEALFDVTYPGRVTTARPLAAGDYRFYFNDVPKEYVICNAKPEAERQRDERLIQVRAPDGTLHEAFFDPVAIGEAIGSNADNGVLDPPSFTLEGAGNVNMNRIDWQSARVEVELDPHSTTGFANHHVDFIALDGAVTLRLDFDDAVEVERDGTRALAWSICDRPWEDGDRLMLRMRTSASDLTGATNDTPCSPPQNLTATSTHNSVTLTWDAPTDPTITGHRILRRPASQETFTQFDVDGAATTTYVDTGDIQPATNYIYRVHAVNAAGISEMARVAVRTLAPPPQNLTATSTHESVTLTWDAPDDTTVTGYRIFRREPGQDTFVQFDVSGATTTTYVDTSEVQPVTKYIYRVHTVYPGGLSDVARIAITTLETPDG